MATPRKRWFKVADSILREDWDDATLATVIRLMAWLNQRRARDGIEQEEAGEALIGEHDAMVITRIRRPHVALQRLAELPLVAGLTSASAALEQVQSCAAVRLEWSKYSNFQRAVARSSAASRPSRDTSDSDSDLRTPTPFSIAEAEPPRSAKKASRKSPGTSAPDRLAEETIQALEKWTRENLPSELTHVRAHIEACLDHFRAKGQPMVDWEATCRNWIRRSPEMRRPGTRAPIAPPARKQTQQELQETARRLRAVEFDRRSHGEI